MDAMYKKSQVAKAMTLPWITKKLELLRKVPPEKEKHYNRLNEHFGSIGEGYIIGLYRYALGMRERDDDPGIAFPGFMTRDNPAHVKAFAIAVGEAIMENFVPPHGNVRALHSKPVQPYLCRKCERGFDDRAQREVHFAACVVVPSTSAPKKTITIEAATGNFMWSWLFEKEWHNRIKIGDGYRICRILSKYLLVLFEGGHATNYVREIIRLQAQTDPAGGVCSPADAARIVWERIIDGAEIDLQHERFQSKVKPGLQRLKRNHTPAEATKAVNRRVFLGGLRDSNMEGLGAKKFKQHKHNTRRRMVISRVPDILLAWGAFTSNTLLASVTEDRKFRMNPMAIIVEKRLLDTAVSVHRDDAS